MITEPPADFISVAELKAHLNKASTGNDSELASFASTACQMIVDRMGQVSPVVAVVEVPGGGPVVVLEHRPVISVTSVQQLPGGAAVDAADVVAGTAGWVLDSPEGVLRHTGVRFGRVRVTYVAGRDPVPATFRMAALELAAHLWRTSQHNTGGGRPALVSDEQVVPGVSYALPYSVRQLLGLDKRPQDEVFVG